MRKHIRKIVSTALITAMLFFAPSVIPMPARAATTLGCGTFFTTWLPADTAFAITTTPCPVGHAHTPVAPWVVIGCAGSIIVSALAANFWQNRELTTPEAWTCGLLYWWYPWAFPSQSTSKQHH
jgi:hypothetical protein